MCELFNFSSVRYPHDYRYAGYRSSTGGIRCPVALCFRGKSFHPRYKLDTAWSKPCISSKVCCSGERIVADTKCSTYRCREIRLYSIQQSWRRSVKNYNACFERLEQFLTALNDSCPDIAQQPCRPGPYCLGYSNFTVCSSCLQLFRSSSLHLQVS